ncbi:hypothetical protein Q8A67_000797 [Cirrhinus molitorella]|uniref:Ig-like domain-containing protein n=1 Tax=Cirrhinus molitorella TaxID=172907 RepID=A0AA88Q614_9TELE|nr:hypothetical protein Q8A67_000797 [Cirrhinus molitorella]
MEMIWFGVLLMIISTVSGESLTSSDPVVKKPGESVTLSCTASGFSVLILLGQQESSPGLTLGSAGSLGCGDDSTGISRDGILLDQSPAVIRRPGETVRISCNTSGIPMTEYYMHWIRQKKNKESSGVDWES